MSNLFGALGAKDRFFVVSRIRCKGSDPRSPRPNGSSPVAKAEICKGQSEGRTRTSIVPSFDISRSLRPFSTIEVLMRSDGVGTAIQRRRTVTDLDGVMTSDRRRPFFVSDQMTSVTRPGSMVSPALAPTTTQRFHTAVTLFPSKDG